MRNFSKSFQNIIITTSKLKIFRISGIFPGCFFPADTVSKKHIGLQIFS